MSLPPVRGRFTGQTKKALEFLHSCSPATKIGAFAMSPEIRSKAPEMRWCDKEVVEIRLKAPEMRYLRALEKEVAEDEIDVREKSAGKEVVIQRNNVLT